jgi:ubiquinol oxidase
VKNFRVELGELLTGVRRTFGSGLPRKYLPPDCLGLTLSNAGVSTREAAREQAAKEAASAGGGSAETFTHDQLPGPMRLLYEAVCWYVDGAFGGRPVARLWFLEVVARMPYFAYTSCLHLYSTLGWWRSSELMNIHYAEQLNEAFHCSVMESLGGDRRWGDRFTAFHAALAYYWLLVVAFFVSPSQSYAFSQALEAHAVDTYAQFIEENETVLKELPQPQVAREYFSEFLYYFDEFQQVAGEGVRRPEINNLYDVFVNILEDELEHTKTMAACVDYTKNNKKIYYKGRELETHGRDSRERLTKEERRAYWKKWAKSHQDDSGSL